VEFKQANLANPKMLDKVFEGTWNFVFNLAAETKYSQSDEVYKESIIDLATVCAKEAVKHGVTRWIEISTAQVYEAGKKPSDEDGKLKPWTKLAKAKLKSEEAVRGVGGLNVVVVRPAIVYGPGDVYGISPRLIAAAVYTQLQDKMEFLWSKDLKLNTVHVADVCAALWHLTSKGTVGEVYNLADSGDTDQGSIAVLLEKIFNIQTGFHGSLASKAPTTVAMKTVADTANDKHLKPWSDLCKAQGIVNTPLTPYLDEELLYNNSTSVDGTKISKTGFSYTHPKVTEDLLREQLDYFIKIGYFPKNVYH